MAFSEELAIRIRTNMEFFGADIVEKKMFGGVIFLYKGKMTVGIVGNLLLARVVAEKYHEILAQKHVKEMDFTGKPLKNFVYVSSPAFETEFELNTWIDLGIEHAKNALKEI